MVTIPPAAAMVLAALALILAAAAIATGSGWLLLAAVPAGLLALRMP